MDEKIKEIQDQIDFSKTKYTVTLDTTKGKINLDLYPDIAPGHCKNIISLAKSGFYNGLIFHRVIEGFVIQGGCPQGTGTGGPGYNIKAEFNDRPHKAGTLSMARSASPDSAGSQFFLCLDDVPSLNNNYTVFGQTSDQESLDVVLAIGKGETDYNDRPTEEVTITTATANETPL